MYLERTVGVASHSIEGEGVRLVLVLSHGGTPLTLSFTKQQWEDLQNHRGFRIEGVHLIAMNDTMKQVESSK